LHLGKRFVSPDGISVWTWPAGDEQFSDLVTKALRLKPAKEIQAPDRDVWSTDGDEPTPLDLKGLVFVSLQEADLGLDALQEIQRAGPDLRSVAVGQASNLHTDLANVVCEETTASLRIAFRKATSQGLFALVNRHPREFKVGGSVLAAALLVASGLLLRDGAETSLEASGKKINIHKIATKPIRDSEPEIVVGKERGEEGATSPLKGQLFIPNPTVRIPQTGVVNKLLIKEGDFVENGTPIAILADLQHAAMAETLRANLTRLEKEFENRQVRNTNSSRSADDSSIFSEARLLATQHRDAAARAKERISWFDEQINRCEDWITVYEERISEDPKMLLAYEVVLSGQRKRIRTLKAEKENLQKSSRQEIASALNMEALTETRRREQNDRLAAEGLALEQLESEMSSVREQLAYHRDFEKIPFIAPWSGEVTELRAKVGSVIPAQSEFLKLRSDGGVFVLVNLSQKGLVSVGDSTALSGVGNFHASGYVAEINDSKDGLVAKVKVLEVRSGKMQNKMLVDVFPEEGSY
jgi:multidrug efflux pump subunit AcrA (membrane-fusion protein)